MRSYDTQLSCMSTLMTLSVFVLERHIHTPCLRRELVVVCNDQLPPPRLIRFRISLINVNMREFTVTVTRNAYDCCINFFNGRTSFAVRFPLAHLCFAGVWGLQHKMFDPAQNLAFQCPRQAAMLGTTGEMVSRRSSANKLKSLSAAAARKL